MVFDLQALQSEKTIVAAGLLTLPTALNLPELRVKPVHLMDKSCHVGKHIVLVSPEQLLYSEMLDTPVPSSFSKVVHRIL